MKNIARKTFILGLLTAFLNVPAYAKEPNYELTIINHFDQALQYTVGINPTTLPDLPVNFTLGVNQDIKTKVLDAKEAYIRVVSADKKNAFFGVNIENGHVKVHGYMGKGIAYSWTTETVTFCTPDEYRKKHAC